MIGGYMLNAADARERALKRKKVCLRDAMREIKGACDRGEYFCFIKGSLSDEAIDELVDLGYIAHSVVYRKETLWTKIIWE